MSVQHVFILGAGRSGTKIIRDCLGAAHDVACIPYDIGFVWRCGNEGIPHDELVPEDLTDKNINFIRSAINRFGRRAAKNKHFMVVLEKSVPNSLRPLVVKSIFPHAKLIHIVRDGRNVVESSMRNWQQPSDTGYMLDKLRYFPLRSLPYAFWYAKNRLFSGSSSQKKLWGPRYEGMQSDANELGLVEVCTKQWMKCVDNCDTQLAELAISDVINIKYEDFVADIKHVKTLCQFAQISDVEGVESFYREHVRSGATNQTTLTELQADYINQTAHETLARHGYL